MGILLIFIYVNELINEYGVKNLIRVGICGGYYEDVKVRDFIIVMLVLIDLNFNLVRF